MIGPAPNCIKCRHFIKGSKPWKCLAFTQGIPLDIIEGYDHKYAYPGDNGIRFEV